MTCSRRRFRAGPREHRPIPRKKKPPPPRAQAQALETHWPSSKCFSCPARSAPSRLSRRAFLESTQWGPSGMRTRSSSTRTSRGWTRTTTRRADTTGASKRARTASSGPCTRSRCFGSSASMRHRCPWWEILCRGPAARSPSCMRSTTTRTSPRTWPRPKTGSCLSPGAPSPSRLSPPEPGRAYSSRSRRASRTLWCDMPHMVIIYVFIQECPVFKGLCYDRGTQVSRLKAN
mmetsp:Transcript_525/g.1130  ORF Transcript_525/g.1130 Transcript_525/m.1130 type:complete len:232 (+) Transcript_525:74-769(+)